MSEGRSGYNKKMMINTVSTVFLVEAVAMIPPFGIAAIDRDRGDMLGMGISIAILLVLGAVGRLLSGKHSPKLKIRESYLVVLLCWISAIIGGMLPYLLAGKEIGLIDSFFESAASWTTTNAWVADIDSFPRALVLWKAINCWLGGMGIILLTIIIFSAVGVNAQKLAGVEITGPELHKHTARMADTAKELYMLYGIASAIEMLLLRLAGVPWFDSVINTMSTISTAGTMDYHGGLGSHFSLLVKIIIATFSILASINFAVYIKVIKGKAKEAVRDYELHIFLIIIAVGTVIVGAVLYIQGYYDSIIDALVNGITGVVSFSCTTGFTLERVETWPSVCKFIFVILMMIGGCSTSTAGGLKVIRFSVIVKLIKRGVYKRIHPRAVKPVMIRDVSVSTTNASSISTFTLLFFGVYLFSVLMISLENLDMETTLTAPVALFTNCGTGFGLAANADYSILSDAGRLYSAVLMVLGRLEMYAILVLFSRSFWSRNR